jgi:hypothetical protein
MAERPKVGDPGYEGSARQANTKKWNSRTCSKSGTELLAGLCPCGARSRAGATLITPRCLSAIGAFLRVPFDVAPYASRCAPSRARRARLEEPGENHRFCGGIELPKKLRLRPPGPQR